MRVHPSHKSVRFSDASLFDEICDDCGATDPYTPTGGPTLDQPCRPRRREVCAVVRMEVQAYA